MRHINVGYPRIKKQVEQVHKQLAWSDDRFNTRAENEAIDGVMRLLDAIVEALGEESHVALWATEDEA